MALLGKQAAGNENAICTEVRGASVSRYTDRGREDRLVLSLRLHSGVTIHAIMSQPVSAEVAAGLGSMLEKLEFQGRGGTEKAPIACSRRLGVRRCGHSLKGGRA